MTRTLPRLLTVLAMALVTVPITPTGAGAEPTKPTLTWAVQPANQHGPDGRRWIEATLDPDQVVTEHLAVRNLSDRTIAFTLTAADGYLTDKGRFNMLASNRTSKDGGTWIAVPHTVTVKANETKVVPFTITVPADATPGDHPAGIAATVTSTTGTVTVESRVGFRVMMRTTGTTTAALTITHLTTTYQHSWNPFTAGTIRVRYTTTNTGNLAATGTGKTTVTGPFTLSKRNTQDTIEQLLPGSSHTVDTHIAGVWALGPLRTNVKTTPAIQGDPTDTTIRENTATTQTWATPWAQLTLAITIGALALTLRTVTRRRRQQLAQLLARAREEGRAEGAGV
jgi:hypothetical protein